ncbi:FAD dependent oxidoreductase [Xylona heveae TC161]|uniref:FAD dependent oxidoreductase n=1 Tax=Xylona heveae (strain CBS 132557 / TC161) TaxID=1328760 RepID=A0A165FBN2_XYLHT|nr:FAD dependent oxidoreductase [Xylona heveae TC161]KZF20791.1 FAD dependent oxidoreductase [Xylona heveae TC161]
MSAPSSERSISSDVLIVGGGIFGISAAYHLSLAHPDPSRITLLDRGPVPSKLAASTDLHKIIRADYGKATYMKLALEAIDAWSTNELFKAKDPENSLYHRTGWVNLGSKGSDLADRVRQNFRESGSAYENITQDLSFEEVRTKWDGLLARTDLSGFANAYYNPLAGWADASEAGEAMVRDAMKRGVKYAVGEAVELVLDEQDKERKARGVRTVDGTIYTAEKILLATGAWTSALMTGAEDKLGLEQEDRVESQITAAGVCVAHVKIKEGEEMEKLKKMPVVVYGEHGEIIPPKNGYLKFNNAKSFVNVITTPSGQKISVPLSSDQSVVPEKLKEETLAYVKRSMPQMLDDGRGVDYWRLCWDSASPTQDHLIAAHPDTRLGNVYFAVGGSFHSYKFLPTIGKYIVNVLNGVSNGEEYDEIWAWKEKEKKSKSREHVAGGGVHGAEEKYFPQRELKEFC